MNEKTDNTPINPTAGATTTDPFDPNNLRLSQNFADTAGVKKQILSIPVRKPDRQWFIRTHPDAHMRLETAVIELKEDRETYLVAKDMYHLLLGEIVPKLLITTINRQGVLSLWPIRLPGPDGRHDEWNRSALAAAHRARDQWLRVAANMSLGAYDVYEATGDLPEPEWPDLTLQEILELAFKDRYIDTPEHPVVERLRGVC